MHGASIGHARGMHMACMGHAYLSKHTAEEVRALVGARADKEAAVGATLNSQLGRVAVVLGNEVLGAGLQGRALTSAAE